MRRGAEQRGGTQPMPVHRQEVLLWKTHPLVHCGVGGSVRIRDKPASGRAGKFWSSVLGLCMKTTRLGASICIFENMTFLYSLKCRILLPQPPDLQVCTTMPSYTRISLNYRLILPCPADADSSLKLGWAGVVASDSCQ